MNISSAKALGNLVKKERKAQGLTQSQLAAASGVGTRFIVDLENGKPTVQIEKAFFVLSMLGIDMNAKKRNDVLQTILNISSDDDIKDLENG